MLSTFRVVTETILKQLVKKKWYRSFCYFFGHHKTPLWPPRYSLGLSKGSQRRPTSQATPSTAQKNLPAQKSRFDLIWNRSWGLWKQVPRVELPLYCLSFCFRKGQLFCDVQTIEIGKDFLPCQETVANKILYTRLVNQRNERQVLSFNLRRGRNFYF